jgi:GT2 family glycosyltransferase
VTRAVTPTRTAPATAGGLLRGWRTHRRRSQMDLALAANVSTRHLSFVETGRAQASRGLLLDLCEHLDVPLRERNAVLLAAGLAPRYAESALDSADLGEVRRALEALVAGHEPFPALVVDRAGDVVLANRAVGALLAASRELVERVGPLDEDLFAYVEDVDWCVRAREAGFEVLIAPDARAWHRVSASTGGEAASTHALYYGTRNTIVVCERHRPLARPLAVLRRAVVVGTFALHALTRAAPWRAGPALRAVREGWTDARAGRLGRRRGDDRA